MANVAATTTVRAIRRASSSRPNIQSFDLSAHMQTAPRGVERATHVKLGFQSWVTTELMRGAVLMTPRVPRYLRPRDGQMKQIEHELHSYTDKSKFVRVLRSMPKNGGIFDLSIDFDKEIGPFAERIFPTYYLQPFHSLMGGWLNPLSMTGHRAAIKSLFGHTHPRGVVGIREDLATLIPKDAKLVYDFGASTSDQATIFLRRLGPDAVVRCVEPSPYGIIVGRRLDPNPRIEWIQGFAEELDLPENSADAVNLMFVAHETPDHIKRGILRAALHVLKPGGRLIWTDPPAEDLMERARGFFEPYKEQWLHLDVDKELDQAGFVRTELHHVVDPFHMWTRVAEKPR